MDFISKAAEKASQAAERLKTNIQQQTSRGGGAGGGDDDIDLSLGGRERSNSSSTTASLADKYAVLQQQYR